MVSRTLSLEKLEVRSLLGGDSGFEANVETSPQPVLEEVEEISTLDKVAQVFVLTMLVGTTVLLIGGDCYVRAYGFPADHGNWSD